MKRFRLLVVAALVSSGLFAAAPPAQARCTFPQSVVCSVVVIVCDVTGRPCAA